MRVVLPEYFITNAKLETVSSEDISIVDYRVYSSNEKVFAYNSSNLIIFVLKGKKLIKLAKDGVCVNVGECVFIKKGNYIMNQIIEAESESFQSVIITLSDTFLENFVKKHIHTSGLIADKYRDSEVLQDYKYTMTPYFKGEIKSLLLNSFKATDYAQKVSELKIEEILLLLLNENDISGNLARYLCNFTATDNRGLKAFMEGNYDKPMSVEDFAKKSGNSLTSFKRHFNKVFNDSPKNWINRKRIEKAQYLLKNSKLNITEICFIVGFNNLSHFIKLFKQTVGCTPNAYKSKFKVGL